MKKQLLLLSATILIVGLTSCKKENSKVADSPGSKNGPKLTVNTLPAPTYNELFLIARKPGENYDTYYTTFHGSNVYVTGSPIYDQDKYPTLANGQPCYAQGMYSDNEGAIDFYNTGTDGNVFQISQGHWIYTDYTQMTTDFVNYFNAQNTFIKNGAIGVEPSIFNYVKDNYKSSSNSSLDPYIYIGKLIRVTTGSHWAVAEVNYPLPAAASTTHPTTIFLDGVPDPTTGYIYHIWGYHGLVNRVPDALSVGGSYTPTANPFVFNVNITIVRKDGSFFNYVGPTIDLS
jgi:hypothetical protein